MQTLGLDVHSMNLVIAHVNGRGKLCRQYERATTAKNLIEVVGHVSGPERLVVEECHLAQWVKHALEPYVHELIVCDPKQQAYEKMVKPAKKSPAFELLQTAPGIGPIIATGYIALIDTPHRFSRLPVVQRSAMSRHD